MLSMGSRIRKSIKTFLRTLHKYEILDVLGYAAIIYFFMLLFTKPTLLLIPVSISIYFIYKEVVNDIRVIGENFMNSRGKK